MEVVDSCAYARIGMGLSWDFCPKAVGKPVPYADSKFCSRNLTVEVRIVSLLSYIYRYSKITLADGQFFFLEYTGYNNQRQPLLISVCTVGEGNFKDVNDAKMHKIEVLKRACVPPLKMKRIPGVP